MESYSQEKGFSLVVLVLVMDGDLFYHTSGSTPLVGSNTVKIKNIKPIYSVNFYNINQNKNRYLE